MTTTIDTTPRVCPACFSCYNDGRLVGQWVDCTDAADVDAVRDFMGCSAAGRGGAHDASPRRSRRRRVCSGVSGGAVATSF